MQLRRYPAHSKTLGEHLRKKRVDLSLSMTQLSEYLKLCVSDATIEKWERDISRPSEPYWKRIVEFAGFDSETTKPTGVF